MLSLKRWEPRTYVERGIRMKLKRLRRNEVKPIEHALAKLFGSMEKGHELPDKAAQTSFNIDVMDQIPEEDMRPWFDAYVKDIEGLELDGEPITTGGALFDEAHDTLRLWVLTELSDLAKLSAAEGKDSSSPHGSSPPAASDGDSPAQSTGPANGQDHSIATETPAEPSSSTQPVEA